MKTVKFDPSHSASHDLFLICRNYRPSSEALADSVVEGAQPADIEAIVEEQLELARDHATAMQQVSGNYQVIS